MSDFFDAHLCKCPHCGTRFASCEGPECHCMEERNEERSENEEEEPMEKGDIVKVYHDPVACKNLEGPAKLLKDLGTKGGFKQEYWTVKFLDDDFVADRWINTEKN